MFLVLFTVQYEAIPHWKGKRIPFRKKNISVVGNP